MLVRWPKWLTFHFHTTSQFRILKSEFRNLHLGHRMLVLNEVFAIPQFSAKCTVNCTVERFHTLDRVHIDRETRIPAVHILRLVGRFGLNGPLRQYFSLYRAVSQRGRKKREMIDQRKKCPNNPRPHQMQPQ